MYGIQILHLSRLKTSICLSETNSSLAGSVIFLLDSAKQQPALDDILSPPVQNIKDFASCR